MGEEEEEEDNDDIILVLFPFFFVAPTNTLRSILTREKVGPFITPCHCFVLLFFHFTSYSTTQQHEIHQQVKREGGGGVDLRQLISAKQGGRQCNCDGIYDTFYIYTSPI